MKNDKLHRAITDIDDSLIAEADEKKKKSGLLKYASIAAALALVIGVTAAVTASKIGEKTRFSVTDIDFTGYKTTFSGDRNIVVYEEKEIWEQIEEFFGDKSKKALSHV